MKQPPLAAQTVDETVDGCWRRIGVAGDRSCAELQRHVHCRNCGVYAGAAQRSLQRPVEADYRDAWARELAHPAPLPPVRDAAALAFRIGAEWLAVPVALASAVARPAPPHRLPHRAGGALLGVVNVDGRVLPAVSLALLLGIDALDAAPPAGRHAFRRLLVLDLSGQRIAVPVAEMHGIVRYAANAVRAPADTVGHAPSPLIAGIVADGAIEAGLLDAAALERQLLEALR
jgi:chemotaxis-related protein WspD